MCFFCPIIYANLTDRHSFCAAWLGVPQPLATANAHSLMWLCCQRSSRRRRDVGLLMGCQQLLLSQFSVFSSASSDSTHTGYCLRCSVLTTRLAWFAESNRVDVSFREQAATTSLHTQDTTYYASFWQQGQLGLRSQTGWASPSESRRQLCPSVHRTPPTMRLLCPLLTTKLAWFA